jgi:5-methylcytosine-specific restriction endonuclease McrA
MVRRAENVSLSFVPNFITRRGWLTVTVGRSAYRTARLRQQDVDQMSLGQHRFPIFLLTVGERSYWRFQDKFYWDNDGLDADQIHALLTVRQQRQQQHIERAQAIVAMGAQPRKPSQRSRVPDDVKQLVWRRDGGRCQNCNSTTELQYDHIIPVSMGGSSNPENIELLCGPCNRAKSDGLTTRTRSPRPPDAGTWLW